MIRNFDLKNIVTPIDVGTLHRFLKETEYDIEETQFLVNGFSEGFDIGYEGPEVRQDKSENIPLQVGTKQELWDKIMKEVQLKRVAGPFDSVPFTNFIQSPVGLVPKAGNKTRMIFHLSYDFKKSGNLSLNACTPKDKCSVKYKDLDYAIACSYKWVKAIRNTDGSVKRSICYSKTDVQSAFHLVPLKRSCWPWLVFKAVDPKSEKTKYFCDKCLPFGASISCSHFQRFSNAIKHILEAKMGRKLCCCNYLDDYLFTCATVRECNSVMLRFLRICSEIGILISHEKTEWGTHVITFLGFLLDGENFKISIPEDKRIKAINSLQKLSQKKKAMMSELQQLAGFLNFLNRAIFPGRAFTRRMYAKFSGKNVEHLKTYHHVCLDSEFHSDCQVWLTFLNDKFIKAVSKPYADLSQEEIATELEFFSDASLNENYGVGARFGNEWIFAQWPEGFIKEKNPSIQYVELLGLVLAVFTWAKRLANKRWVIFCDNSAVLDMVNHTSTGGVNAMFLVRQLILKCLEYNFRVFAKHIRSEDNQVADSLSWLDVPRFCRLAKKLKLKALPEKLPMEIWPPTKIWINQ